GMIVRAALGAGAHAMLLPDRGGALVDEGVVRSSAGAVFHLPVANVGNLADALRGVRERGFWVFGLDGEADQSIYETPWPDRVVLVMGNESKGIRPGVRRVCDVLVRIPLDPRLESLNVAVSAGVALFEAARAHRALPADARARAPRYPK
ncbi:MAG: RNA methyltransferase, partial [Gemmatimonadaceae bacterium]|nr:RNA methyltransferase [Gemmatimonadaceae bacterium]